jgi:2,3-bisphosphoglycerate-independent phosphoglycerate mutase
MIVLQKRVNAKMIRPKPFVLVILDGFGARAPTADNAIAAARKPNFDALYERYAHTLISGSGHDVGLPHGQMGNSEVGHINLGSGRVVYQELTRIDHEIETGNFFTNATLLSAVNAVKTNNSTLHIFGLLSAGGVHSFEAHFAALIELAHQRGLTSVMLHAFLDGRDTPPKSAESSIQRFDLLLRSQNIGQIASIVGRYYAMDRDQRWDRIEAAYELLTKGKAVRAADSAVAGLELAYAAGETDEFVKPTLIKGAKLIANDDVVIFMNFRSDRARELTHAFVDADFNHFERGPKIKLAEFVTLTDYEKGLPVAVAYPPQSLNNVLGDYASQLGLKQLRIAETEKYAHVTFFFNGGREQPFAGEERILIPSPKVATYDLQPEMSAFALTEQLVAAIESQTFDLIVCNYANADMVGHTGNFAAAVKAIETLDACIGKVVEALKAVGGEALITADHGNAEKMQDETTGQAHTAHTTDPVPLIYVGRPAKVVYNDGILSDIAPTLLSLMGIAIPSEMTGRALLKLED